MPLIRPLLLVKKGTGMQKNRLHAQHSVSLWTAFLPVVLLPVVFVLLSGMPGNTEDKRASNTHPLAFGKDQAIIDLQKVPGNR
jgi:hypothetical protein